MESISYFGQLIIGISFLISGIMDLIDYKPLLALLEKKKIPYHHQLLPAAIALKGIGGLALMFDFLVPLAAFLLAIFILIANVIFHNFWAHTSIERKKELTQFLTYIIVVGGLLVLVRF